MPPSRQPRPAARTRSPPAARGSTSSSTWSTRRWCVTLGNFATKLLLRTTEGITRLRGKVYPFRRGVLIPTFHPAAVLRGGGEAAAQMRADLVRAKQHLRPPDNVVVPA